MVDEPMMVSSSLTRRSILTMVCISEFEFSLSSIAVALSSSSSFLFPEKESPCRTAPTNLALPSLTFLILSNLVRTSTRPLINSPGSTFSSSRSLCISGLEGSANSCSRAESSVCRERNRCERGTGRSIFWESVGEDGEVGEGGYAY
jgi:hypothetical protein